MGQPPMVFVHIPVLNSRREFAHHKRSVIIREFPLVLLEKPMQILRVTLISNKVHTNVNFGVYSPNFSAKRIIFLC